MIIFTRSRFLNLLFALVIIVSECIVGVTCHSMEVRGHLFRGCSLRPPLHISGDGSQVRPELSFWPDYSLSFEPGCHNVALAGLEPSATPASASQVHGWLPSLLRQAIF